MSEVMTRAKTAIGLPELEPVAHPDCRLCHAADRGRSASRINRDPVRVKYYSEIISAHPHMPAEDDQAEPVGEGSPLMLALRARVGEKNGMRRAVRLDQ